MNNYIKKLAKDNIKKNMKFYKYIFLSIFFSFFIITLACILSFSFDKATYEEKAYEYGYWDASIVNITKQQEEKISSEYIKEIGNLYYSGEVIYNDEIIGSIGYFDTQGQALANLHFIEGSYPLSENEIVIEKTTANQLQTGINKIIDLNYQFSNKSYNKQFKVVGIIEDYADNWSSRGLSFITFYMESYERDMFFTSNNVAYLWNDLFKISKDNEYTNMIFNTNNYPEIQNHDGSNTYYQYTNETSLLPYAIEIILVSFTAVMSTMLSSLSKRESQFVMFRTIGMTFKQLQRLIIYEVFILSLIATISSVIIGVIVSLLLMFIYSMITSNSLIFTVNITVLLIEYIICIIVLYIGIVLPTLTVYDLPLTKNNGYYIYHSQKKKIRKPTYLWQIKNELNRSKVSSAVLLVIIVFMIFRGTLFIDDIYSYVYTKSYYQEIYEKMNDITLEQIPNINLLDLMEEDKDIHIYKDMVFTEGRLTWEGMLNEEKVIADYRRAMYDEGVDVNIISADYDEELNSDLSKQNVEGTLNLEDNEAIVILSNVNYSDNEISYNAKREENSVFPKDEGLYPNHTISVNIAGKSYSLKVKARIILEEEINRDFNQNYNIVLNENTYMRIMNDSGNGDYVYYNNLYIDVDNEYKRVEIENICNQLSLDFSSRADYLLQQIHYRNEKLKSFIYIFVLLIISIFLIYIIRILSTQNLKRNIGLMNILGMTKKRIFMLYFLASSIIYSSAFLLIILMFILGHNFSYILPCIIFSCLFYIIYLMSTLIPIKSILKEKSLELIR